MGKRQGVTKSGRIMNPADRERKQQRQKELKRNKKERVKIRQTIVKSRDPRELIDHMERLDDQEFDLHNELAMNVIADKRGKYRGAFIQMIALYRQEKDEKQVKELETMLQDYEMRRFKKEQHYKAELFSKSADPDEIPLPTGAMAPNAAGTPFMPPPPTAPQFHPMMRVGILKKTKPAAPQRRHRYPPGPPCGVPPRFYDEDDDDGDESLSAIVSGERRPAAGRRVHFDEGRDGGDRRAANRGDGDGDEDDDYGPVEIPESMQKNDPPSAQHDSAPPPQSQPFYARNSMPLPPAAGVGHAGLIPPSMAPLPRLSVNFAGLPPPGMAPPPPGFPPRGLPMALPGYGIDKPPVPQQPHFSAVISAAPQVNRPSVGEPTSTTANVISAAPQMRNLKKETTRFVPTALRVNRPTAAPVRKPQPLGGHHAAVAVAPSSTTAAGHHARSTDEACDEFLREIQDLL